MGTPEGAAGREACDPGLRICGFYGGVGGVWLCEGAGQPVSLRAATPGAHALRSSGHTCTHTPPAGQKAQPWAASLKISASSVENGLLTSPGGLCAESLVSEGGGGALHGQPRRRGAGGRGTGSAEPGALRGESGGLHAGEPSQRAAQRTRRPPPSAAPLRPSLSLHRKAPTRSK